MCKPIAEGGRRCAAHTRPRYDAAIRGTQEWDDAAAAHASTPTGRLQLAVELATAETQVRVARANLDGSTTTRLAYRAALNHRTALDKALERGEQLRDTADATERALAVARHEPGHPATTPGWANYPLCERELPPMPPLRDVTYKHDPVLGTQAIDPEGNVVRVWTEYATTGAKNEWLNNPDPNCTYLVRPSAQQRNAGADFIHIYQTAHDCSTQSAFARGVVAYKGKAKGLRSNSTPVGHQTHQGLDRGHLIASEFGGGMDRINLVSMPSAVNRLTKPETARGRGFKEIADLMERYAPDPTGEKPALGSGEIAVPNYRAFENAVNKIAAAAPTGSVSLHIFPTTYKSTTKYRAVTDMLVATVYAAGDITTYRIDNDT